MTAEHAPGTTKASRIVDEIFEDLRDRRFLKWLFDPSGTGTIDYFRSGEPLTALDLEVQQEIRGSWVKIVADALEPAEIPEKSATIDADTAWLRDQMAMAALQGIGTWMPRGCTSMNNDETLKARAEWAYRQADAMLEARARS